MASGSFDLTTYYAKRIIGDNNATTAATALLYSGIETSMWIFGHNRSNYGIKYLYDNTTNGTADKIEFHGGSAADATAWVQLDTGAALFSGEIIIGTQQATSISELTYGNRITIIPYHHTGGPWYIKSGDDASNAYLSLFYSTNELVRIKHDGFTVVNNEIDGTTIKATNGKLYSTANGNTVSIGSGNSSWCHIQNSTNIPFIFNNTIACQGDCVDLTASLGTQRYPFHHLILGGAVQAVATDNMTAASTNPRITFQDGTNGTQPVHLIYTDVDDYRAPAGLKVIGGTSATPAWFEVEGDILTQSGKIWIRAGSDAGGNSNRLTTTSGMPGNMQYNQSRRGTQIYANGIAFCDPYNGNSGNDAGWIRHQETTGSKGELEIAVGDDGDETIVVRQYKTDNTIKNTVTLLDANGNTNFPGNIVVTTTTNDRYVEVKSTTTGVRLELDNSGSSTHGVWSSGYWSGSAYTASSLWMLYRDSAGIVYVNGRSNGVTILASNTAGTDTNLFSTNGLNIRWYDTASKISGQPSQYGFLFTVSLGESHNEIHQFWAEQANGSLYHRGTNGSSHASPPAFKTILDSSNYTSYTVTKTGSGASGSWGISITGSSASCTGAASSATYASSYLASRADVAGTNHAVALQNYFNSNKSTEPRNVLVAHYSSAYGNGSMCMGYFLNGYDSNPYGGFFVAHYKVPRYVGIQNGSYVDSKLWKEGDSVTGAVWNDYAEYRTSSCTEPGYCVFEVGDDTLAKTTERLQHFAGIISDTWGFSQGETETAKTPIAVSGRVLVYTYRDRNEYKPGDCVCAAPNGTVDIMTRDEIMLYPDKIVGTVSCVPEYEEWGGGEKADRNPVKINGRIWIKVK